MTKTKKSNLRIVHGDTEHSYEERLDCLTCLEVEIEFLQAIKKAGGRKKFAESLRRNNDKEH